MQKPLGLKGLTDKLLNSSINDLQTKLASFALKLLDCNTFSVITGSDHLIDIPFAQVSCFHNSIEGKDEKVFKSLPG